MPKQNLNPRLGGGITPLERELQAMMRQAQQRATPPRAYIPAKVEAPKMDGIRLNPDGTITIHDQTLNRDQFKAALDAIHADPKSAYNNVRDPNHKQAVQEMYLGRRGLAGELSDTDIKEILVEWNQALETTEVANELLPHQEIAQIVGTPAGRIALQRARTGQPLDKRQAWLVKRHNELEAANNTVARKEQAAKGGWMTTKRPHMVPAELHAIERIADAREKVYAIRQQKAAWRDDPRSPFNDTAHPEHKNYVEAMNRLYVAEADLGKQPEDGE